ncbi:MAG: DUF92 domain-containing protein [Anaerolineales bacterium]|nr:DUF92 domain-containing protein [Anaerolineales bacterium]
MWNDAFAIRLILAFVLSAIIGTLAWRVRALSKSGALAAWLIGGIAFGVGGWRGASILLTFFVSSSLLSRAFARRKEGLSTFVLKGSQRDAGQVFANGGFGSMVLLLSLWFPDSFLPFLAYCGAFAAANADTWATELGVLSTPPPRLITNGNVVPKGTSGGVTPLGLLASLFGAALIGGVAALFVTERNLTFLAVSLSGLLGSLFDSYLGARFQAVYFCPNCQKETERYPDHSCGERTRHVRGLAWLDNDGVNFACTVVGATIATGMGVMVPWLFR